MLCVFAQGGKKKIHPSTLDCPHVHISLPRSHFFPFCVGSGWLCSFCAYLIGSMHMHTFPYIVHIANHHVFNVASLFTRRISICLFCSTQSCVGQLMILRVLWYWKIGIRTFSILFSNWRSGTSDLSSSLHNNKSLAVLLLLIFVHAKWE